MYEIIPDMEVEVQERDEYIGPPWNTRKVKQKSYTGVVKNAYISKSKHKRT